MDSVDRELSFLAESVERTVRVQREAAVMYLDAKPQRGTTLVRHLVGAYDALIKHVQERRAEFADFPDDEAREGAITEMRQLVAGARSLQRSLSWLDAAATPPLDLGTRYFVERTARALVSDDAEVTVVTTTERSYATVTNPLSLVFEIAEVEEPSDGFALVVFVPRREQDSGLLHPLMIHELAHAAATRHGLVEEVLERGNTDQHIDHALQAVADAHDSEGDEEQEALIDALKERLGRWVEEALCDAVAAAILGPTYLYSFVAIVGTSDLDAVGDAHPSTRHRIRMLLEILDELGWKDVLASTSQEIDDWCRGTAGEEARDLGLIERFCIEALSHLGPHLREIVHIHVGQGRFLPAAFEESVTEIKALLEQGIPPAQRADDRSIDRSAIILGSWIFAVKQQGGGLASLATAPDIPELSRLLPKALESAAVLDAWHTVQDA